MKPMLSMVAAASLCAAAAVNAAPFAMITDVKGEVWAIEGATPRKLSLLSYIEAPTEVKVEAATKLAITYFATGTQYNFEGPGRVSLESSAPRVLEGQAAQSKSVAPAKSIAGGGLSTDQWRRLQQATVVMRVVKASFTVVGPDKTAVLTDEPEFEWTAAANAKRYRVVVYGADNQILHEATTDQTRLRPGAAVKLEAGKQYRWKVDALAVPKPASATGAFSVADSASRERLAGMRPAIGSDLAARIFYATTLEAEGHAHDARAEWKALAREFPDVPELKQRGM